jgi:hypothetical protein
VNDHALLLPDGSSLLTQQCATAVEIHVYSFFPLGQQSDYIGVNETGDPNNLMASLFDNFAYREFPLFETKTSCSAAYSTYKKKCDPRCILWPPPLSYSYSTTLESSGHLDRYHIILPNMVPTTYGTAIAALFA